MQYLGGKTKIAKQIADTIRHIRAGRPFWDPFCGGLSSAVALAAHGPGIVSDVDTALLALYSAIRAGWDPPEVLTREAWLAARDLPDDNPMRAFAGYGCSFGGKWFSGYAGARLAPVGGGALASFTYARSAAKASIRKVRALRSCTLLCVDFLMIEPRATNHVLYLDPPYAGTTEYRYKMDHDAFWSRVFAWAQHTDVFVSGYACPVPHSVLLEMPHTSRLDKRSVRVERLFRINP